MASPIAYQARPLRTLISIFIAWKAFLLTIALGSNFSQAYDTSTSILFERLYGTSPTIASAFSTRLSRWDAIYFIHVARDGYVYEQEWAFGTGLSLSIRFITHLLQSFGVEAQGIEPLAGIALANASHLMAALVLYKLTNVLTRDATISFISSVLCIISPAGLFLSSPSPESPFSFLCFLGTLIFALRYQPGQSAVMKSLLVIISGAIFGIATTFRSNGLTYGLLFAVDVLQTGLGFLQKPAVSSLFHTGAAVLGGLLVASGSIVPQAVAWSMYCRTEGDILRPWCSRTVPSIYTFVQDEYWNVGFLRYWTLNQLPLFLIAAPALALLIQSGWEVCLSGRIASRNPAPTQGHQTLIISLAASQAIVALLALTTYHVQIITRLASGYPVWYWWIASSLCDDKKKARGHAAVIFMVMYAGIQGVLYASFLPPA